MDLELHYQFKQPQLCRRAFIHSSYAHEHPEEQADNEVLEFLGDACLNCFVTLYLCQMFPSYTEGELSALRAHCVDQKACYDYAHALQLPQSLLLGKGEQKNRNNRSIVAALFEALLGAIILDGGYAQAMLWFQDHVLSLIVKRLDSFQQDYKRVLQEKLQQQFHCLPRYVVIKDLIMIKSLKLQYF